MDEVDPEKVTPLPVWYLVAFTLVWGGFLAAPQLAWERLDSWELAGLFGGFAVLLGLLLFEFRRRGGPPLARYRERRQTNWPFMVTLFSGPTLVTIGWIFLSPPVFVVCALGVGALVADQLRRINESLRAEAVAGR